MHDANTARASMISERILQAVRSIRIRAGHNDLASITVSIGIAQLNNTKEDLDSIISRADRALYTAKNRGRDQAQIAD